VILPKQSLQEGFFKNVLPPQRFAQPHGRMRYHGGISGGGPALLR
jgi:hypothetical protein